VLIYVVDDEPMLLELASVILEPLGYDIKTFRLPDAAVDAYKSAQKRPALIITDYAMHNMNGMDLLEACRRVNPAQKILLVSGTVGPDIYAKSPSKPNQFLAKPYHAKELIDVVKSTLAG
jgi:CheY-like chemotaxis protein